MLAAECYVLVPQKAGVPCHIPGGQPEGGQFTACGDSVSAGAGTTIAPSKAQVEINSHSQADIEGLFEHTGLTTEKVASIVGAPDDATVRLSWEAGADKMHVQIDHPLFFAMRDLEFHVDGTKSIYNDIFVIKEGQRGAGLGAQVFAKQVHFASQEGFKDIHCLAAGNGPNTGVSAKGFNGYYTWPRFGYNAPLDEDNFNGGGDHPFKTMLNAARIAFPKAKSVLDIMQTPNGRDWWKANGRVIGEATFDLAEKSRSMRTLADYLKAKADLKKAKQAAILWMKTLDNTGEHAEEIDLSDEDEAALALAESRRDQQDKNSCVLWDKPLPGLDAGEQETCDLTADVLLSLFGPTILSLFESKGYEPCRDDRGRFAPCGSGGYTAQERVERSTARLNKAKELVARARTGTMTLKEKHALVDHLLSMTGAELGQLKKTEGIEVPKAALSFKPLLVSHLANQILNARSAQPTPTPAPVQPAPQPVKPTPAPVAPSVLPSNPVKDALRTSPVVDSKPLKESGLNVSRIVTLANGSKGVFKPASGEHDLTGIRKTIEGRLYAREGAASDVADLLGMSDLVPATVIRDVAGEKGSCQAFVPGCKMALDMPYEKMWGKGEEGKKDLARAAAFDYLTGNQDRHPGNWMVKKDGKIVLIDNGLSFPNRKENETNITARRLTNRAMDNKLPIPAEFKTVDKEKLVGILKEHGLSDKEISVVKWRLRNLQKSTDFGRLRRRHARKVEALTDE